MNVRCTHCGGDVPIQAHSTFVQCPFCEAALYVELTEGLRHMVMSEGVAPDSLSLRLQRVLGKQEITATAKISHWKKIYWPFWHVEKPTGGGPMIAAKSPVVEDFSYVERPPGNMVFFQESSMGSETVVEPDILVDEAISQTSVYDIETVSKNDVISLVHMPTYQITYACQGQEFEACIDGVSGEVYADVWPVSPQRTKSLVLGGIAFAVFCLLFVQTLWLSNWGLVLAYPVTLVGAFYLIKLLLKRLGW